MPKQKYTFYQIKLWMMKLMLMNRINKKRIKLNKKRKEYNQQILQRKDK